MADPNIEADELARMLQQINEELRQFGTVTNQTAQALAVGSSKRARDLETAGEKTVDALGSLVSAAVGAAKALKDGQKGAAALNGAISDTATALTTAVGVLALLIPIGRALKPLGGALSALGIGTGRAAVGITAMTGGVAAATVAIKGFSDLLQAANTMADQLYKGYSGLARSGAVASDGMTGLFEDAKRLGLSMNELDSLVGIVAQSSGDLALFASGVAQGRRRIAEMGRELESSREYFLTLGYGMEEVTQTMIDYMRQQRVAGDLNNRTASQLAEGARRYLEEQDALTKLTGMARQEQEKAREQVRSQERFAAQLEQLRRQGREEEAKALEDTYLILRSQAPELAQGFADIQTGNVQTEAAQKSLMSSQGESLRVAQQILAGQIGAAEGAQRIARATGQTATDLSQMGLIGTFDETFGPLNEALKLRALGEQDIVATLKKIQEDRARLASGEKEQGDELTRRQAKLITTQIAANEALERFVMASIPVAQTAVQGFTDALLASTDKINELFGVTTVAPRSAAEASAQRRVDELEKQVNTMREQSSANIIGRTTGIGLTTQERELERTLAAAEREVSGLRSAQEIYESGLRKAIAEAQREANTQAYGVVGKLFQKDVELSLEKKRQIEDEFRRQWQAYSRTMQVPGAGAGGYAAPAEVLPAPTPMFGAAAPAPGVSGGNYLDMVAQIESNGRNIPSATAGSSAHGVYQITRDTFEGLTKLSGSPLAGRTFEEMQRSVELQRQAVDLLTSDNVRQLAAAGVSTSDAAKYLAHFLGGPTAVTVLKSNDNTPIEQVVGDSARSMNPGIFTPNIVTVRDLKELISKKTGSEFARGGIATGPDSGYPVTLHGTEAVIPLPDNKAVPVTISLKDAAAAGTGAYGENEYTGVNIGPISTDLEALKQIAGSLGAYDAATETITDPATWKEILKSGMLMNYDMGGVTFGTKLFGPEMAAELGAAVKDVMATTDGDVAAALQEVKDQFKEAMNMVVEAMKNKDYETQQQMLETLQNIARSQDRTADASHRMALVATN